jgi:phosphoketolase
VGPPCPQTAGNELQAGVGQLKDKLVEHKQYIDKYGKDLPEIRNWKWDNPK